ncbi:Cof-type HAD-IIB family hydrolase [Massilicoli timonensis]|uniref:Cof-type HAD-IIB family hydrolase n=1 Tax=Massilicoli timonensis TaxID=2015901 RepID=UPI0015B52B0F
MKISLIAMDMDGTLLQSDQTISEKTTKKLIELQQKGIKIVLVSGRNYNRLKRYAEQLQLEKYGGYLIEVNGMAINDLQKKQREVLERLSIQQARELFALLQPYEVETQYIMDDGLYVHIPEVCMQEKKKLRKEHHIPDDFPWTAGATNVFFDARDGYARMMYMEHASEIVEEINKVGIPATAKQLEVMMKDLSELSDTYWIGRTTPTWLEIMPVNLSKGKALRMLAQRLSIPMSEVMCFGDGENDLSMFEVCAYPIAMSNAMDIVKQKAYTITVADHDHDGIIETLKQYHIGETEENV